MIKLEMENYITILIEAGRISALSSNKIHKYVYKDQSDLTDDIDKFIKERRPKNYDNKQEKEIVTRNLCNFLKAREMVLNGFKSKIFLTKSTGTGILNTDNSKLKILTPKQMLQRLTIALAQAKAGNNSENLLNEIRQIIYSLYQSKEITKKVYHNLMKS